MRRDQCIDAGRDGCCPCELAEHGSCLVCGRLRGETCQECGWQGVCIYALYEQNGRRLVKGRGERLLPIREIKRYSDDFRVFVVEADKGFCQKAQTAGAYVFVRRDGEKNWYDAPVSVLKAEPEDGLLHLGIYRCGAKTDSVFQAEGTLWVRGVYFNALAGLKTLSSGSEETFVYAKGIAIAPLRNFLDGGARYTKWLKNLHLYIDLEKIGFDFFKEYFGDLPAEAIEVRSFAKEGLCPLDDLDRLEEERQANVLALTSPFYAGQVERAAGRQVVRPIEGNFCCGEGVCGACTCVDELGQTVRRCKARQ